MQKLHQSLAPLFLLLSKLSNGLTIPQNEFPEIVRDAKCIMTSLPSIPKTYRALVAQSSGQNFSSVACIKTFDIPNVEKDEALIRVSYAGINGGCETFRARGEHAFRNNALARDFGLGAEGVGTVVAVGSDVSNVQVGDSVCFVGSAFAEYSKCKAATLWKIPSALPEYVGLRISALTACAMLEQTGKLQRGEMVLITAAAGGAGHLAVQIAKLAGCEVIGTCGSDEKRKMLEMLECDHVINYKDQNLFEELKRIAPNGVDVVLEGVGGKMLQISLDALSPTGRLLQIGYISEYPHNPNSVEESKMHELDACDLFWNSKTVQRGNQVIYGNAWPKDYSSVALCKDRVLSLFSEQKLKSIVDHSIDFVGLDSISEAINYMLSGNSIGKVVVEIS